ncbi:MAG: fructose-1,6-bisphosphatase [Clostridia bacterium]|nr:fructose-1,6-bisphosphatase [Clostridia bacterium]
MDMEQQFSSGELKYLRLLGEQFPTVEALCTQITRLSAQLGLPKGTEHFMSDIHGEYEAFCHIMNNCSGVIREKVHLWLNNLPTQEADALCTLIYYPDAILRQRRQRGEDSDAWYKTQVERLVHLARMLSSKYTRERVRRAMPEGWAFLLDELMHYQSDETVAITEQEANRLRYHDAIIDTLAATASSGSMIKALAALIKNLAVDRLHVVGDIFDRGPRADSIMDILMAHHSVDIEWGNHDVLWMGAASGSACCIAGALRNSLAYGNTEILERGYGIPLRELELFAERAYPGLSPDAAMLHAVSVMMFKLEGQLVRRNPEFEMEDRLLLHKVDLERGQIEIEGETWPLKPIALPTVDWKDPYALSPEEERVMNGLRHAFTHSIRLREHVAFLYRRGWLYRAFNGNLLFHGCVPLNEDGSFLRKTLGGVPRGGKALMDHADQVARRAFYKGDQPALDFMWYLWCGTDSPVCGRQIKTFARAFVPDERAWHEPRNPYYAWYDSEEKCREILAEFGLTAPEARIVNGHTPIRVKMGESPLKANGRLIVIDGGFCRAYQKTTGIAGYTLVANSHGLRLISHQPFTTLRDAQETGRDIHSRTCDFAPFPQQKFVSDTDSGRLLRERMDDLLRLLEAYRSGALNPQR